MRKRFEQSAARLLRNIFQVGLFENPYIDPASSVKTVGNAEYMKAGFEVQQKSIVLLKNKKWFIAPGKRKDGFHTKTSCAASRDWFGNTTPEKLEYPVNMELVKKYFNVTDDPSKADMALVFVKGPIAGTGYDKADRETGNGYVPISLQYGPTPRNMPGPKHRGCRDPVTDPTITNRSYKGKTITASNHTDLKLILDTKAQMGGKPVRLPWPFANRCRSWGI